MRTGETRLQKTISALGETVTGPVDLVGEGKPSALFYPMVRLLSHLLSQDPGRMISRGSMALRRAVHPLLLFLLPLFLERKQVFESKNALLGIDAPDTPEKLPGEPVIWCPNHGFKDDIAASIGAARHAYIFFGSLPAFFNTFDGIGAYVNGVVLCNRKVRASRGASMAAARRAMEMGVDMIVFPEGVWNKTPDKLLLDFWPGAYRLAAETGSKIIPVVHYLADPDKKYRGNVIHTVIGDPISMAGLSEQEGLALLRDTMATWYFLLMEKYGRTTRKELLGRYSSADEAWEAHLALTTGGVKYYDREIELCADHRPRDIVRPEEVWQRVAEIAAVSGETARHVRYARQMVAREGRRDFQRRF